MWRSPAGPTEGIHPEAEKHTDELQADMMMLKVEELVGKTWYFYAIKTGLVLVLI